MSDFYGYFKENMEASGLPAPQTLFATVQATATNASIILSQVDKFGKEVTIGELIAAGTKLEGLATIGACCAAFYVGAIIGSLAVATSRSLSGGPSVADVLMTAGTYQLGRPWLMAMLYQSPELWQRHKAAATA